MGSPNVSTSQMYSPESRGRGKKLVKRENMKKFSVSMHTPRMNVVWSKVKGRVGWEEKKTSQKG